VDDLVAVATLILAAATFLLALFTHRMAVQTREVAERTAVLADAANRQVEAGLQQVALAGEQVAIAKDDAARAKAEAIAAQQPHVMVELVEGQTIGPVRQREGMNLFYLWVEARLVNHGGHAIVDQIHVTGSPKVETRPPDLAGLLPAGGRLPFRLRFDLGNAAEDLVATAYFPIKARAVRLAEWSESLYFINAKLVRGAGEHDGGWHAEVGQPLDVIKPRAAP
jgi:hypothetical protein